MSVLTPAENRPSGDAAKNLEYLEVAHVFIRRANQGCPALSEAKQAIHCVGKVLLGLAMRWEAETLLFF
jgi:hypothetical protein